MLFWDWCTPTKILSYINVVHLHLSAQSQKYCKISVGIEQLSAHCVGKVLNLINILDKCESTCNLKTLTLKPKFYTNWLKTRKRPSWTYMAELSPKQSCVSINIFYYLKKTATQFCLNLPLLFFFLGSVRAMVDGWLHFRQIHILFYPTFRVLYYTHCQGTALQ